MPLGAILPAIAGAATTSILGGLFGGGGGGGSDTDENVTGQGSGSSPLDFYAQYGAQAAAAQNPLSLAANEFGAALQGSTYAQALLAQALQQGSATALADAVTRGNLASQCVSGPSR
jgi:hypothetical protein